MAYGRIAIRVGMIQILFQIVILIMGTIIFSSSGEDFLTPGGEISLQDAYDYTRITYLVNVVPILLNWLFLLVLRQLLLVDKMPLMASVSLSVSTAYLVLGLLGLVSYQYVEFFENDPLKADLVMLMQMFDQTVVVYFYSSLILCLGCIAAGFWQNASFPRWLAGLTGLIAVIYLICIFTVHPTINPNGWIIPYLALNSWIVMVCTVLYLRESQFKPPARSA